MPMITNMHVKQLLVAGSHNAAEAFDIKLAVGREIFQRGALLYAGVLAEASPLAEVPCEPEVFASIANSDIHSFIWESIERLNEEASSFCSFVDTLTPALEVSRPAERHLVRAGAGLMHVITTNSLKTEDIRQLEDEHPELIDLEEIFREIENQ